MLSKAAEVIEKQSQIIRIQADVINDLYSLKRQTSAAQSRNDKARISDQGPWSLYF